MEEKDHRASSSEEIIKEREREGRLIREKKSNDFRTFGNEWRDFPVIVQI